MAAPDGRWHIVANGFQGDLDLSSDGRGRITGTARIDSPEVDPVLGSWDEGRQRIVFQREVTAADGSPQHYTGHMFEADASFMQGGRYGPPDEPAFRVLAGSFDGTGASASRPVYAWLAWQRI